MCDEPVRTKVLTDAGWRGLQEYLIVDGGEPAVAAVELEGIAEARADAARCSTRCAPPTRSSSAPRTR